MALDGTTFYPNAKAIPFSAIALEGLMTHFRTAMAVVHRLSRRYPPAILEQLINLPVLHLDKLNQQEAIAAWAAQLQTNLTNATDGGTYYKVETIENTERHIFLPCITVVMHGLENHVTLGHDFFSSSEYRHIGELSEKLHGLLEEGAYVQRDDRKKSIKTFKEAFYWLMEEAKRGQLIQRYKGLGEMNPEQLWETTMDPSTRRMLRVTVEDAVSADQIFTALMGDQVDPRRAFIEQNALAVSNLDV